MLRLLLMRHAKAETPGARRDFDRALAPRGERAAPLVGRALIKAGLEPDRVLCSTAIRTRQTLDGVATDFSTPPEIDYLSELYDAETDDYIEQIQLHGGTATTLMVVGHNPATEEATALLAGPKGDLPPPGEFPTGAVAVIEFAVEDWSAIRPNTGRLRQFIKPRDLE